MRREDVFGELVYVAVRPRLGAPPATRLAVFSFRIYVFCLFYVLERERKRCLARMVGGVRALSFLSCVAPHLRICAAFHASPTNCQRRLVQKLLTRSWFQPWMTGVLGE